MTEEENGTINIAAIRFCWTCRMYELKTMFIVSFSSFVTMIHSINLHMNNQADIKRKLIAAIRLCWTPAGPYELSHH